MWLTMGSPMKAPPDNQLTHDAHLLHYFVIKTSVCSNVYTWKITLSCWISGLLLIILGYKIRVSTYCLFLCIWNFGRNYGKIDIWMFSQINSSRKGLVTRVLVSSRRLTWMCTPCPGATKTSPLPSVTTTSAPARRTSPPPVRETVVALWRARSAPHGSLSGPLRGPDMVARHRSPVSIPVCPTSGTGSVLCQDFRGMCERETETKVKLKSKRMKQENELKRSFKIYN